jgi:ABC-type uncharacterized transport system substrate-binding protein
MQAKTLYHHWAVTAVAGMAMVAHPHAFCLLSLTTCLNAACVARASYELSVAYDVQHSPQRVAADC